MLGVIAWCHAQVCPLLRVATCRMIVAAELDPIAPHSGPRCPARPAVARAGAGVPE